MPELWVYGIGSKSAPRDSSTADWVLSTRKRAKRSPFAKTSLATTPSDFPVNTSSTRCGSLDSFTETTSALKSAGSKTYLLVVGSFWSPTTRGNSHSTAWSLARRCFSKPTRLGRSARWLSASFHPFRSPPNCSRGGVKSRGHRRTAAAYCKTTRPSSSFPKAHAESANRSQSATNYRNLVWVFFVWHSKPELRLFLSVLSAPKNKRLQST